MKNGEHDFGLEHYGDFGVISPQTVSASNKNLSLNCIRHHILPPRGARAIGMRPTMATVVVQGAQLMRVLEFQVCRRGRQARWVVTIGDSIYGAYLDKEQALLDAVDAARDALQGGREAQVWIRDRSTAARVF